MIKALSALLVIALAGPAHQQSDVPLSPCPNVFMYETASNEPGRWYGVVNLSTDSVLHGLWLHIMLDAKADILGNWVGDVTTTDNMEFKVENTKKKINPGPAEAVRFFVQYNVLEKIPKLQAIRLNGKEICNANNRQPVLDRLDVIKPVERPSRPREPKPTPGPNALPPSKEVFGRPTEVTRPVYIPTENPPINESHVMSYSIGGGPMPDQSIGSNTLSSDNRKPVHSVGTQVTSQNSGTRNPVHSVGTQVSTQNSVTRNPSSPNRGQSFGTQSVNRPQYQATPTPMRPTTQRDRDDDYDSPDKSGPEDYFSGGPITFIVSGNAANPNTNNFLNNNNNRQDQCGKVVRNNPNPLVVNGKPTQEGQWPWQIALYQTQTVDNKYICGGTLVSRRHVITAAHCVTRKASSRVVNKNTLTIYLGKHNLRTSVDGVQIMLVADIRVHPQYNASSFSRDLSVLKLRGPVSYTDYVRPACLWPETETDLSNVIGMKGSVVGWGFDDSGVATEELTLVEMPVVDQETCIRSYSEFFSRFTSEYTYCAGYRDGTSVCNGDSGGGMVFERQHTWYLRGLVSLSVARQNEYRCDPTHYVVFTDLAKFSTWIKSNIEN